MYSNEYRSSRSESVTGRRDFYLPCRVTIVPRISQLRPLFLLVLIPLHLLQLRALNLPADCLRQETRADEVDLPRILVGCCILFAEILQFLLELFLVWLFGGGLGEHHEGFDDFVARGVRGGDDGGFHDGGVHF